MLSSSLLCALRRTLCGAVILGLLASSASARKNHTFAKTSEQPLWRFHLRSVGYTAYVPPQKRRYGAMPGGAHISFSDDNTLIATFLEPSSAPTLATRGKSDEKLAYRLHGVFLNLPDGRLKAAREWPVVHRSAGVLGVGAGRFVLLTPLAIRLYAADFHVLSEENESELPRDNQKLLTEYALSPTADLLMAQYVWQNNDKIAHISWIWFDVSSLESRHRYFDFASPGGERRAIRRQNFAGFLSFTDREVAVTRIAYRQKRCAILLSDWDNKWRPIPLSPVTDFRKEVCEQPQFVADGLLGLVGQSAFRVLQTRHLNTVCEGHFNLDTRVKGPLRLPLQSSRDGSRLAVPLWRYEPPPRRENPLTGYSLDRVEIFDLRTGNRVDTVIPPGAPLRHVSALALSPDGSRLAISANGAVEVFRLLNKPEHNGQ